MNPNGNWSSDPFYDDVDLFHELTFNSVLKWEPVWCGDPDCGLCSPSEFFRDKAAATPDDWLDTQLFIRSLK